MSEANQHYILQQCQAQAIDAQQLLASLWSGHGQITRLQLKGSRRNLKTVVLKQAKMADNGQHPRGWQSDFALNRKRQSYSNEVLWYQQINGHSDQFWRTPNCFGALEDDQQWLMLLEDLPASGFEFAASTLNWLQIEQALSALAYLHAYFLQTDLRGLWSYAGYWHLHTRPDEWQAMQDQPLKQHAQRIEQYLHNSDYHCICMGMRKRPTLHFPRNKLVCTTFNTAV